MYILIGVGQIRTVNSRLYRGTRWIGMIKKPARSKFLHSGFLCISCSRKIKINPSASNNAYVKVLPHFLVPRSVQVEGQHRVVVVRDEFRIKPEGRRLSADEKR